MDMFILNTNWMSEGKLWKFGQGKTQSSLVREKPLEGTCIDIALKSWRILQQPILKQAPNPESAKPRLKEMVQYTN